MLYALALTILYIIVGGIVLFAVGTIAYAWGHQDGIEEERDRWTNW